MTIERLALLIGLANAAILLIKPIPRIHARLDLIEYRLSAMERVLDELKDRG